MKCAFETGSGAVIYIDWFRHSKVDGGGVDT
jgi:hypothetical protein